MTGEPRYKELHEVRYRELKASGLRGWGGEQAPEREKYWREYWATWTKPPIAPADFPKTGHVLELGAGAGNITPAILAQGYRVTGIEISPTAVELASKANPEVSYFEGSVTDFSRFSDGAFEIVFDGLCIHCIIGEDRKAVFSEIRRVLKPGGFFFFNTICDDPKDPLILKDFDKVTRCHSVDGTPYRYLGTKASLRNELRSNGFVILYERTESKPDGDSLRILAQKV